MRRSDLEELEKQMMKVLVKRRAWGEYSADAEGTLTLCEMMFKVIQHLLETYPPEEEVVPKVNSKATSKRPVRP
jgi:hypothetical protein